MLLLWHSNWALYIVKIHDSENTQFCRPSLSLALSFSVHFQKKGREVPALLGLLGKANVHQLAQKQTEAIQMDVYTREIQIVRFCILFLLKGFLH